MSVHKLGSHVRLWVLIFDSIESLFLVPFHGLFDIFETGGVDVVQVIGKDDRVLHGVYGTGTTTWEELVSSCGEDNDI
jgi:hypothetical protein